MPAHQTAFQGEEVTRRYWDMGKRSRAEAVDILITLLRERQAHGHGQVTFYDIVKRKLGISGDSIPEALVEYCAEQFKMIRDARHLIKDAVDDLGEFTLVIVSHDGDDNRAATDRLVIVAHILIVSAKQTSEESTDSSAACIVRLLT